MHLDIPLLEAWEDHHFFLVGRTNKAMVGVTRALIFIFSQFPTKTGVLLGVTHGSTWLPDKHLISSFQAFLGGDPQLRFLWKGSRLTLNLRWEAST